MLLLHLRSEGRRSPLIRLYIPLCFYYIDWLDANGYDRDDFTFHYASTISQRLHGESHRVYSFTFHYASTISKPAESSERLKIFLYIPLCFYYIGRLCPDYREILHLYIPLCFYYIRQQDHLLEQ